MLSNWKISSSPRSVTGSSVFLHGTADPWCSTQEYFLAASFVGRLKRCSNQPPQKKIGAAFPPQQQFQEATAAGALFPALGSSKHPKEKLFYPCFLACRLLKQRNFSHQELWERCLKHENGKGASSKHCGVVGNIWDVWSHGAEIPMEKRDLCWKKHSRSSGSSRICFPGPLVAGKAPGPGYEWWLWKIPWGAAEVVLAIPTFPLALWDGNAMENLTYTCWEKSSSRDTATAEKNILKVLVLLWGELQVEENKSLLCCSFQLRMSWDFQHKIRDCYRAWKKERN